MHFQYQEYTETPIFSFEDQKDQQYEELQHTVVKTFHTYNRTYRHLQQYTTNDQSHNMRTDKSNK